MRAIVRFIDIVSPGQVGRRIVDDAALARDLTGTSSASVTVNDLLSVTSSLRHDILAPSHAAVD
jgi:hypothetical protein